MRKIMYKNERNCKRMNYKHQKKTQQITFQFVKLFIKEIIYKVFLLKSKFD